jgi:hypothetical protein
VVHCRETKLADIFYTEGEKVMDMLELILELWFLFIIGGSVILLTWGMWNALHYVFTGGW